MGFIIGISGGTGSGKTTVAEQILDAIGPAQAMILHQDHYYKDLSHLPKEVRDRINFDHPDACDWDLLVEHLSLLNRGKAIEKPIYSFHTHCRLPETRHIEPRELIIVEGILVFEHEALRRQMDIKIFVDTDADVRFIRRLQRDIRERGRSIDSVVEQYLSTVRPMHLEFVEPSKRHADIIIPEGGQNRIAIDMVISRLQGWLLQQLGPPAPR
jgi:uridine kinase